ncbi:UNKNOWN [Stylonychia lemnae]|uniref:Transmembrane protein n=1 Tax=Stylonychia lemnae TaxID=5949 RepID=A0A078A4R0_STYLE|nr:UNKNOWN [Stylonychia lemnae]|eukprot:CDW77157.1 UNKNOWN [Stylonychia lemnae]
MKLVIFLSVAFVIFVNIVAMIYRRDMVNQVVIKDFDHSTAKEGTVIRVNDKAVYRKIISEYFPPSNESIQSAPINERAPQNEKKFISDEINEQPQLIPTNAKENQNVKNTKNNEGLHGNGVQWEIFSILVFIFDLEQAHGSLSQRINEMSIDQFVLQEIQNPEEQVGIMNLLSLVQQSANQSNQQDLNKLKLKVSSAMGNNTKSISPVNENQQAKVKCGDPEGNYDFSQQYYTTSWIVFGIASFIMFVSLINMVYQTFRYKSQDEYFQEISEYVQREVPNLPSQQQNFYSESYDQSYTNSFVHQQQYRHNSNILLSQTINHTMMNSRVDQFNSNADNSR